MGKDNIFRSIPSVDKLLGEPWLTEYLHKYDRDFVKSVVNEVLEGLRQDISAEGIDETAAQKAIGGIEARFRNLFKEIMEDYLKPVINCTGIVIHTNLGRAPLPEAVIRKAVEEGTRYINLEFDIAKGERSSRNYILDKHIGRLFPGYKSVVVNNNAAAVMLVLNTFAHRKEVIVSRGELVEIGGSFRVPEVMKKSGAVLREVGTTNKTHISDYEEAVNDKTGLIMTVHPSNYRITGFTASVNPGELVPLAREKNIPLFHDMGSGNMFESFETPLTDEPSIRTLTSGGIPLISFSGDKLLGGCQAGIIIGKPELIDKLRKNQLLRAIRADKITYIILSELMKLYMTGEYRNTLPVYRMLTQTKNEMRGRVESLRKELKNPAVSAEIIEGDSFAGGGTAPSEPIPTVLLALMHEKLSASAFAAKLRSQTPPVITRIENGRVIIDLRTVFPDEEQTLSMILNKI